MNNTNKTLKGFLESLDDFRLGIKGQSIDIDEIFKNFVSFVADKSNDLYIYSDRENHPLAIEGQKGKILFVYTSFNDIFEATFDGKNVDFLLNSAYSVFKDISQKENIEGIYINQNIEPAVFVPKDIIKKVVDGADYLQSLEMN